MPAIQFKRFTKPQVLRRIGRGLLEQLLQGFQEAIPAGSRLPALQASDEEWYTKLGALLLSPERLSDGLNDALFAIDEMATPEGQERFSLFRSTPVRFENLKQIDRFLTGQIPCSFFSSRRLPPNHRQILDRFT